MAFTVTDEAPITKTTVDLAPYREVVQASYDGEATKGIVFDTEKDAKVNLSRFRSAADALGYGLRSEIVEMESGKFKVRLLAQRKRQYTLSEEKKIERTRKAAATRAKNKAAKAANSEPAPKGSKPAKRAAAK